MVILTSIQYDDDVSSSSSMLSDIDDDLNDHCENSSEGLSFRYRTGSLSDAGNSTDSLDLGIAKEHGKEAAIKGNMTMNRQLNKSFATINFDGISVASDTDDERQDRRLFQAETTNHTSTTTPMNDDESINRYEARKTNEKDFDKEIGALGIRNLLEFPDDSVSVSELSELTLGNQSYILDLAMQKEARNSSLKEEVYEEALVLYTKAKEEGHHGEEFFLALVAECQKKIAASKVKHYKRQDERLDMALDEELKRRQEELNDSARSIVIGEPAVEKGRSYRLSGVVEREEIRRKSAILVNQDMIRAGSEMVLEMSEDAEYDWGMGSSDDEEYDIGLDLDQGGEDEHEEAKGSMRSPQKDDQKSKVKQTKKKKLKKKVKGVEKSVSTNTKKKKKKKPTSSDVSRPADTQTTTENKSKKSKKVSTKKSKKFTSKSDNASKRSSRRTRSNSIEDSLNNSIGDKELTATSTEKSNSERQSSVTEKTKKKAKSKTKKVVTCTKKTKETKDDKEHEGAAAAASTPTQERLEENGINDIDVDKTEMVFQSIDGFKAVSEEQEEENLNLYSMETKKQKVSPVATKSPSRSRRLRKLLSKVLHPKPPIAE